AEEGVASSCDSGSSRAPHLPSGDLGASVGRRRLVPTPWNARPAPLRQSSAMPAAPRDPAPWRIAIDTGGTFTDAIALSPTGELRTAKVLSSGALRATVVAAE